MAPTSASGANRAPAAAGPVVAPVCLGASAPGGACCWCWPSRWAAANLAVGEPLAPGAGCCWAAPARPELGDLWRRMVDRRLTNEVLCLKLSGRGSGKRLVRSVWLVSLGAQAAAIRVGQMELRVVLAKGGGGGRERAMQRDSRAPLGAL